MRKSRAQQDADRLKELEAEELALLSGGEDDGSLPPPPGQPNLLEQTHEPVTPPAKPDDSRRHKLTDEQIDQLMREAEDAKRSAKNYERELASVNDRQSEFDAQIAELRAQLESRSAISVDDYGLTEEEREFENVIKVSEKITKAQYSKLQKELDAIKASISSVQSASSKADAERKVEKHRSEVKRLINQNPDDLFTHPKIEGYLAEIPLEEANALRQPLNYSPEYVAAILNRFMGSIGAVAQPKAPAPGDVAVPRRSNPDSSTPDRTASGAPRVQFNPATFQKDVNRLMQNGRKAEAEALINEAERQMSVSS